MESGDPLLEGLNPQQVECVTHIDGPLMILAGAGSGKTKTITRRIAYLIERGAAPESILSLTFTNKAANEMKERAMALLNGHYQRPLVSTFHSFGRWVLRRFANLAGLENDFVIFDDNDQLTVVRRIVADMSLDEKEYPPRALLSLISKAKISMADVEAATAAVGKKWQQPFSFAYERYHQVLKENNAVDFDDLLVRVVRLLEKEPQVLEFLQNRFLFVQVDEYQDTNLPQYLIVKMIAQEHRNLCVVGDDDQSIYSWRGANTENLRLFEQDFPEAKVVKLEENYRSTQTILEVAWHVVKENTLRKEKRLYTANPRGEPVVLYVAHDERDEANYVADKIQELAQDRPLSHFAVFYRTNAQSRPLEEALARKGIPYRVVGGLRFYDRREVKDVVAYLRLVENPDDVLAFRRVVNVPRRGIGEKTVERLLEFCARGGFPLGEGLEAALEAGVLASVVRARLLSFVELMEGLREASREMPLSAFIDHLLEKTGYRRALEEEGTVEAQGRLENLRELINVAVEYDDVDHGLREFIDRASLATPQDEGGQGDMVTLMTLHSAKGLEFPVVLMVGMEEGFLPHSLSMESLAGLEEERRLCYVGITRAMERLFLIRAKSRLYYGRERVFAPSRFLNSIPHELVKVEGETPREEVPRVHPSPGEERGRARARTSGEGGQWQRGDRVLHPIFGPGRVVATQGEGDSLKVKVVFDKVGEKLLVARFARLKRA